VVLQHGPGAVFIAAVGPGREEGALVAPDLEDPGREAPPISQRSTLHVFGDLEATASTVLTTWSKI